MDTQDPNKTQLMGSVPSIDADGDATVFMPSNGAPAPAPAPAPRSAAMTSRLRDLPTTELPPRAAQTTVLPDSAPTTVAPAPAAAPAPDGIDVLGDPYVSPVDLGNLTTARRPVELESPVKSTKKKGLPIWGVVLAIVLALAAMGAGAWYTYEHEYWGGHTVPLVIGLDQQTATERLEAAGFKVTVAESPADDGIGTVLACDPEPGKRAETKGGATITVAVARTIPQVTGQPMEDAQQTLLAAGAANIHIQPVNSDAEAGTVVSVDPAEGTEFKSTDEITLSVATPYVVPSVVGKNVEEAKAAVEKAGLTAHVNFVKSEKPHNEVIETSPEAGTQASEGDTVELQVSSPYPDAVEALAQYFSCTSSEVAKYMEDEKYTLTYGSTFSNGDAHAVYTGQNGNMITFTANPEVGSYAGNKSDDVLAAGAPISGVRYVYASGAAPQGALSETGDGVRAVMYACGFTGLKETCTASDLEGLGYAADGRHFICAFGEDWQSSWAVLIGGPEGQTNVVAMAFLKSRYSGAVDLSQFGNSPAKFIAYANLYDASVVSQKGEGFSAAEVSADNFRSGQ